MNEKWTVNNLPDLSGKIIIITGSNSGIGFEAAREMARKGAEVIMASRNQEKAEKALAALKKENPSGKLTFIPLDLASLASVKNFVDQFKAQYQRLDVLLNNAGIMMIPERKTEDGFERQIGTNHLGHFALTGLLIDLLLETPGARIVNISSLAHNTGKLDFSNFFFENGGYTPMAAYGRSKLANLLFTYELQRRFESMGANVSAFAAHPGISATGLTDHFVNDRFIGVMRGAMNLLFQGSAMGALPGLRAAVDPQALGGQYYGPDGKGGRRGYPVVVSSNQASKDLQDAQELWKFSETLTGISYLN